jgi:hypothetical protein
MTFSGLLCSCPHPIEDVPGRCPVCGGLTCAPRSFAWPAWDDMVMPASVTERERQAQSQHDYPA